MYKHFLKRFFDFIIVLIVLLCIWWIIAIIAVWLHFANKGAGVFFTQERPGKGEKIFKVIKFKSMTDERDASGKLLPDAQRLTKVGRFIRSTSLDELPQLINVLKGDMALIGPRPLLPKYLPYYTEHERLRHTVRPGITGWAQANGRNLLTWDQKLEMDVWYVEHLSLAVDIRILLLTIKNVIKKEGVVVVNRPIYLDQERIQNKKHLFDKVRLRPLELSDLKTRVAWIKDPRVFSTMDIDPTITMESTINWYCSNRERTDRVDLVLEDRLSKKIIAFTGITGIENDIGETYSFVSPEEQGKGFGTVARYLTCKYGFEKLSLKIIKSYCNEDNVASIKVNDRLGYKYIKTIKCKTTEGTEIERRYYELTCDRLKLM